MTLARAEGVRLGVAIGASVLLCGVVLWPISYAEMALLEGRPSFPLWLLLGVGAGLVAGFLYRRKLFRPMLTVPAGFAIAVV